MTSDDVCAVIGPQMWIAGEESKYTKMLAGHKSHKTSGIMMQESIYEQAELRQLQPREPMEIITSEKLCQS